MYAPYPRPDAGWAGPPSQFAGLRPTRGMTRTPSSGADWLLGRSDTLEKTLSSLQHRLSSHSGWCLALPAQISRVADRTAEIHRANNGRRLCLLIKAGRISTPERPKRIPSTLSCLRKYKQRLVSARYSSGTCMGLVRRQMVGRRNTVASWLNTLGLFRARRRHASFDTRGGGLF